MSGLFLIALLVVGYLIYVTYGKQLLAEGRKGHIKIGVIVLGLIILAAVATGRANVLLAPLGAAMALITRFGRFLPVLLKHFPQLKSILGEVAPSMKGAASNNTDGGRSRMQTSTLVMIFDHASGEMNGTVKRGQFEGYNLNELSVGELRTLHKHCAAQDPEAMRLLNVYLARYHSAQFGAGEAGSAEASATGMTDSEAYDILGLSPGATKEEITQAHRSLIGKVHPDKGGSTYLATKINAARDHLS